MGTHQCDLLTIYPLFKVPGHESDSGLFLLILGLVYICNSFMILYWIKYQEHAAKLGDHLAVRSVIFPVFVDVMWFNAIANLYIGFIFMFVAEPTTNDSWLDCVMWSTIIGIQHMITEGVAYMLLQKGMGRNTQIKVVRRSTLWGLVCFCYGLLTYKFNTLSANIFQITWDSIIVLFYAVVAFCPEKHLYRRPAATYFARWWLIWSIISFVSTILLQVQSGQNYVECVRAFGPYFIYALCEPFLVYKTLVHDSFWWQGQFGSDDDTGFGAGTERNRSKDILSPLQGQEVNLHSAQSLANALDTMITEKGVKLLNFAYIELDTDNLLGQGAFSKVYGGRYKKQKCAIKLVFTFDLTVDVIKRVASEAQILAAVSHPNIVHIFGVAVLPPSVCILLENCYYGCLSDILRGKFEDGVMVRKPLSLSYRDLVYIALGCARGLSVIHSLGSSIIHRDIKSYNFLVDSQLNAKLADLETGGLSLDGDTGENRKRETGRSSTGNSNGSVNYRRNSRKSRFDVSDEVHTFPVIAALRKGCMECLKARKTGRRGTSGQEILSNIGVGPSRLRSTISVHNPFNSVNVLPHWMAPEVFVNMNFYSQASDIYSLGVVFWELITRSIPYEGMERLDIISGILRGDRLPIAFPNGSACNVKLSELILDMWKHDAMKRPKINDIVKTLDGLWNGECYSKIRTLDHDTYIHLSVLSGLVPYQPLERKVTGIFQGASNSLFGARTGSSTMQQSENNIRSTEIEKIIQLVESLCSDSSMLHLDSYNGAYVIVSGANPHLILKASASWIKEFHADKGFNIQSGISLFKEFINDQYVNDDCIANVDDEISIHSDTYLKFIEDISNAKPCHHIVKLRNSMGIICKYSLHCYPLCISKTTESQLTYAIDVNVDSIEDYYHLAMIYFDLLENEEVSQMASNILNRGIIADEEHGVNMSVP